MILAINISVNVYFSTQKAEKDLNKSHYFRSLLVQKLSKSRTLMMQDSRFLFN